MAEKLNLFKEILFSSSDPNVSRQLSKAEREGVIKKISSRIYTTNLLDAPENIVKRNLFDILSWRYPGAVISHRSASELRPTNEGELFLTSTFNKRITDLPGVAVTVMKGASPIEGDVPLYNLFISSEPRWMLENMQISRRQGEKSKTFPASFIENRLEKMILVGGEEKLNEFRDKLHETSVTLEMPKEFEKINHIISALLATHSSDALSTRSGRARAGGLPFDESRGALFEGLYDALKDRFFTERRERAKEESSFRLFSFFESYFSNYIEGTRFEIDEAREIVETGKVMPKRIKDSHDILATFALVSNREEMNRTPQNAEELFELLRHRHGILMEGREECLPGFFKDINNQAGNTHFVDHTLVKGTLQYGFKYYAALSEPLAKAIFMMFMVSEVHPFMDGNGRISRIMMNAELVRGNQNRIIIPTVFREDYILSLRKLSRQKDPEVFIRIVEKLHQFSENLIGSDFDELKAYLQRCNAFEEPEDAKLICIDRAFEAIKQNEDE